MHQCNMETYLHKLSEKCWFSFFIFWVNQFDLVMNDSPKYLQASDIQIILFFPLCLTQVLFTRIWLAEYVQIYDNSAGNK